METNVKVKSGFVQNFLNSCPFSSLDLSYEKSESTNNICGQKFNKINDFNNEKESTIDKNVSKENICNNGPLQYGDYLMLDKLLSCQEPITRKLKEVEAHDEHLFIVTHQAYELWFKQVLHELDSVRSLISKKINLKTDKNYNDDDMLKINSRLNRIVIILKVLVDQWQILETMTPLEFVEFRAYLKPASGFQSLQFRLMENKLGVRNDLRVNYGKSNYIKVFQDKNKINSIISSQNEPSLHDLIEKWLETNTTDDFIENYSKAIKKMFKQLDEEILQEKNIEIKQQLIDQCIKQKQLFDQLTNEERYNTLITRGDRRFSFQAFKSALCVFVNKEDPQYSMMFQVLTLLQEIDTLLNKWRTNHVYIVLKMIGTDLNGTGGSSGYQYLKSTLTDRYKIFVDLFNISSYLIPKIYMNDLN